MINKKLINFQNLSSSTISFFKQKMIELPVLDWHIQDLLLVIGRDNLKTIMDVLIGRIKKNTKKKIEEKAISDFERYETIPYHFNTKLGDLGYKGIISDIDPTAVERMKSFDHLSAGKQHTDFFANRVTNYSKGNMDWDESIF